MGRGPFGYLPSADEGAFDRMCASLDPEWVEAALEATGVATVRKRRLPAEGGQTVGRGGGLSGFPLVRLVTLMALRSHLLAAAHFGPYGTDERKYALKVWPQVPDDSLCVMDRHVLNADILVPLARDGTNRHWLLRAKKNTAWRTLKQLGQGEELVELQVSDRPRKKDDSLPMRFEARAIRYQRKGFQPQWLLTSLLDAEAFPASEVVALYHERWELKFGTFRELHPRVEVEVLIEDRFVDIVAEGYDAGVRLSEAIERHMVQVRLSDACRFVVVGAPGYLAHHGTPQRPEDLLRHACITFRVRTTGALYDWQLTCVSVQAVLFLRDTSLTIHVR